MKPTGNCAESSPGREIIEAVERRLDIPANVPAQPGLPLQGRLNHVENPNQKWLLLRGAVT